MTTISSEVQNEKEKSQSLPRTRRGGILITSGEKEEEAVKVQDGTIFITIDNKFNPYQYEARDKERKFLDGKRV